MEHSFPRTRIAHIPERQGGQVIVITEVTCLSKLILAKNDGLIDYEWFSFMDVNYSYWNNEVITIRSNQ